MTKNITEVLKLVNIRKERIDTYSPICYNPVPADVLQAIEKRIVQEEEMLRSRGKDPRFVSCEEADKILQGK